jgi:hypothetical protein
VPRIIDHFFVPNYVTLLICCLAYFQKHNLLLLTHDTNKMSNSKGGGNCDMPRPISPNAAKKGGEPTTTLRQRLKNRAEELGERAEEFHVKLRRKVSYPLN